LHFHAPCGRARAFGRAKDTPARRRAVVDRNPILDGF
jgi:hypothetical protein